MAARKVEEEIERLNALRDAPAAEAAAGLRKALRDRVNLMVAKAARIAAGRRMTELIPDLLASFERLMEKAAERDPQCWGKSAIVKALVEMEHGECAVFVRGLRHVQLEPVWGRSEDTAASLRGQCAVALPACTDLTRARIFRLLADAVADQDFTVRLEVVRALAQMEGEEGALLLRMKARLGDQESRVTGQAFDGLLALEGTAALPFVGEFLSREEQREEAALALGAARLPQAVAMLRECWKGSRERDFRGVLLRAISASRQEEGIEFLLGLVRGGGEDGAAAFEALKLHRESAEIWRRVEEAR
jgi:hypothetical protein